MFFCCLRRMQWSFTYNLDANKHNEVHCLNAKKLRFCKLKKEGNNIVMHIQTTTSSATATTRSCNYTQGLYENDVHLNLDNK